MRSAPKNFTLSKDKNCFLELSQYLMKEATTSGHFTLALRGGNRQTTVIGVSIEENEGNKYYKIFDPQHSRSVLTKLELFNHALTGYLCDVHGLKDETFHVRRASYDVMVNDEVLKNLVQSVKSDFEAIQQVQLPAIRKPLK